MTEWDREYLENWKRLDAVRGAEEVLVVQVPPGSGSTARLESLLATEGTRAVLLDRGAERATFAIYADDVVVSSALSGLVTPVPNYAEGLMMFLFPADRLDEVLGDLEERFHSICHRRGIRFATVWYWWQAACAIVSRIWAGVERVTKVLKPT